MFEDMGQLPKGKTKEDLFQFTEDHFGIDQTETRAILASHHITTFNPGSWWTYVLFIRQEMERRNRCRSGQYERPPAKCPLCGSDIERNPIWDKLFGSGNGWRCKKEKGHFFQYKWRFAIQALNEKWERLEKEEAIPVQVGEEVKL